MLITCISLAGNFNRQTTGGIIDMGKLPPEIYTGRDTASGSSSQQHENDFHNICGTFAAEGMTISKSTRSNLDRIASGQTSYQQVLTELRAKYEKRW